MKIIDESKEINGEIIPINLSGNAVGIYYLHLFIKENIFNAKVVLNN